MNINIPDKVPKLFVAIGIAFFIYSAYIDRIKRESYQKAYDEYNNQFYKVRKLELLIERDIEILKNEGETLSMKYGIQNQIEVNDSIVSFDRTLNGEEGKLISTEILDKKWNKYNEDLFILKQEKLILEQEHQSHESSVDSLENGEVEDLVKVAGIFFAIGLFLWWFEEYEHAPLVKQTEKIYSRCQSCAKSFSSTRLYGTNQDGTQNLGLCNTCYKQGEFIDLNFSPEEYKEYVETKIKNFSWLGRWVRRRIYYNVERWK